MDTTQDTSSKDAAALVEGLVLWETLPPEHAKPLGQFVLVKFRLRSETKGGMVLPVQDVWDKHSGIAEVIACGPEVTKMDPGDYVWTLKYAGMPLKIGDSERAKKEAFKIFDQNEIPAKYGGPELE